MEGNNYEKQRAERIRLNQLRMAEIGLDQAVADLEKAQNEMVGISRGDEALVDTVLSAPPSSGKEATPSSRPRRSCTKRSTVKPMYRDEDESEHEESEEDEDDRDDRKAGTKDKAYDPLDDVGVDQVLRDGSSEDEEYTDGSDSDDVLPHPGSSRAKRPLPGGKGKGKGGEGGTANGAAGGKRGRSRQGERGGKQRKAQADAKGTPGRGGASASRSMGSGSEGKRGGEDLEMDEEERQLQQALALSLLEGEQVQASVTCMAQRSADYQSGNRGHGGDKGPQQAGTSARKPGSQQRGHDLSKAAAKGVARAPPPHERPAAKRAKAVRGVELSEEAVADLFHAFDDQGKCWITMGDVRRVAQEHSVDLNPDLAQDMLQLFGSQGDDPGLTRNNGSNKASLPLRMAFEDFQRMLEKVGYRRPLFA
eukprot:jgi/Mesvir1/24021/Mv10763-RA.1